MRGHNTCNEGTQHMFSLRSKKTSLNDPQYPLLSPALLLMNESITVDNKITHWTRQ